MACYASILEMAYEWQDMFKRTKVHFFHPNGEWMEPSAGLMIHALHHTLALLSIPMNLYYHDSFHYWCMVSSMQFAASFAYMIAEYTYMLDVKTKSGLFRM